MKKPGELRAHLVKHLPELGRDADRLLVFVDAGSLVSTYAPGLSFETRYTLNVILTDMACDPDVLFAALLLWIRDNQPELLANAGRREEVRFEVEVLANDKVDVSLKVPLTERTVVTVDDAGTLLVQDAPEPVLDPTWTT